MLETKFDSLCRSYVSSFGEFIWNLPLPKSYLDLPTFPLSWTFWNLPAFCCLGKGIQDLQSLHTLKWQLVALQEKKHPEITYSLYGVKYHLQPRLESMDPTRGPKNGILSKEPLRRPWHGTNCWTWWKLMWRKRWCDDSWPWTAFHRFSWVVEEILFEFSYWNLRSVTQQSQLRRDRETATLPPPSYGSYPDCPNRSRWTAGLRMCCFPLQTRLDNKCKETPKPRDRASRGWTKKILLPEGRDLFQTGCVGTGGDFEDCMNRRTRPLHCEVMIQRHMKICKLSSQTDSNNEGSMFPAVRLKNCQQNSLSQIRQTQSWSS